MGSLGFDNILEGTVLPNIKSKVNTQRRLLVTSDGEVKSLTMKILALSNWVISQSPIDDITGTKHYMDMGCIRDLVLLPRNTKTLICPFILLLDKVCLVYLLSVSHTGVHCCTPITDDVQCKSL